MPRTVIVTLRMNGAERDELERAAATLGVPMSKIMRTSTLIQAERVNDSAVPDGTSARVVKQPEWADYIRPILAGELTFAQAVKECGQAVAKRMKADAEEAARQAEEAEAWAKVFAE